MSEHEIIVAGSGPAGVFTALAALKNGDSVTIIDPGFEFIDSNTLEHRDITDVTSLSVEDRERDAYYFSTGTKWLSALGSLYCSSHKKNFPDYLVTKNCNLFKSEAKGGLSRVWGRGIEPPYIGETNTWSFGKELDICFEEVLKRVPLSGGNDSLEKVFKKYTENINKKKLTSLSEEILERWKRSEDSLCKMGINFGRTRLAIRENYMFSANHLLDCLLEEFPNLQYKKGWKIKSYIERKKNVEVEIISNEGIESVITGRKLVLACGAVETTHLVMKNQNISNALMKSSDVIVMPFFSAKRQINGQALQTLSDLTLTIKNKNLSKKAIVVHLFAKNLIIENLFKRYIPKYFMPLINYFILDRCFIAMCFLHSDDSQNIDVFHSEGKTTFTGKTHSKKYLYYVKLFLFFLKNIFKIRLLPIPISIGPTQPGTSIHFGASLPTDMNGRLKNSSLVFVADSASLPDIPAGSYTLTIMANAYRIGDIVSKSMQEKKK